MIVNETIKYILNVTNSNAIKIVYNKRDEDILSRFIEYLVEDYGAHRFIEHNYQSIEIATNTEDIDKIIQDFMNLEIEIVKR